ncbi:hypothetical protein ANCDUO_09126 [Ancylostoma duodenale]|uniref:CNH domain-containing protein n=1 Tax=Ancylostoma duodenale TaxID=51022 RepID=A0A0C2GTX4_9BILA|nr:hypothetical protein ANCDUO_09126 [Ancylostoma duodenale]
MYWSFAKRSGFLFLISIKVQVNFFSIADQRRYMIEDVHKTIEDIDQMPPPPELPTGGLPKNVESIIIGQGVVKFVTGVIVLPNGTILATDEEEGLILFDTQGNVLRKIFSALYELTPVGQWTELQYRLSESYVDMLAFAVIGPITQILIVEGRKNYVLQISVRDSEVVDRRRLAVCERPGAMARDEAGEDSWAMLLIVSRK